MSEVEAMEIKAPKISIVATPIGHLGDLSVRAVECLRSADVVLCEDTRVTRKLLQHCHITNKTLVTYADHNEREASEVWLKRIHDECLHGVLVSDAGTPLISDPGYRLVRGARKLGIRVEPVPGPSAVMALISASGLACDRFQFVGFIPEKKKAREDLFKSLVGYRGLIVAFESVKRLEDSLECAFDVFGDIEVCMGRELTKLHEEILTMKISELLIWVKEKMVKKGEVSLLFSLEEKLSDIDDPKLLITQLAGEGLDRMAIQEVMKKRGFSKKEVYQILLDIKKSRTEVDNSEDQS